MDDNIAIRWDIAEEHLDEAAFLYGQWEAALRSPDYTLAEIAEGPEERLLAHLDGLVLGGERVAKKLLLPALGADEPGLVFAATFALVDGGRPADFEAVLAALEQGEPVQKAAIRRALSVVPRADLGQRLAALALKSPAIQADLLEVLGYLRVDPGLRLEPLANSRDPAKEALALRLARVFPERLDPMAVERGFNSPHADVRAAALETAAIAGHPRAMAVCESTVKAKEPGFATAALLLGLSGEEKWVPLLVPALRDEKVARDAAFALGFTGLVSAADALLDAMKDEKLAPVAAEGFAAITGVRIEKQFAKPAKKWNPEEEDEQEEEYGPEADLPKPDAEVIARWWQKVRPRLYGGRRWLRGKAWSVAVALGEFQNGPARRHATIGLELAVRTGGGLQLPSDAPTTRLGLALREAHRTVNRLVGIHHDPRAA